MALDKELQRLASKGYTVVVDKMNTAGWVEESARETHIIAPEEGEDVYLAKGVRSIGSEEFRAMEEAGSNTLNAVRGLRQKVNYLTNYEKPYRRLLRLVSGGRRG